MIGIYKITSPSGKSYIGQSWNIEERFITYKRLSCKNQRKLYASFKKYGVDNHVFSIIEQCNKHISQEELDCKELFNTLLIPLENRLNLKYGRGRGRASLETRELIAAKHRKKISQYGLDGNYIKTWDSITECAEEFNISRSTVSCSLKNRTILKNYLFIYGISQDNIGEYIPILKKKPKKELKEKTKQKTKQKPKEKPKERFSDNPYVSKYHSITVFQYTKDGEFIKRWNSVIEAAHYLKTSVALINNACRKQAHTTSGYIWRYDFVEKVEVINKKKRYTRVPKINLSSKVLDEILKYYEYTHPKELAAYLNITIDKLSKIAKDLNLVCKYENINYKLQIKKIGNKTIYSLEYIKFHLRNENKYVV